MRYFVEIEPISVTIRYTIGEEGALGHGSEEIAPGESFLGISYDELRARGAGEFEVDDAVVRAFLDRAAA